MSSWQTNGSHKREAQLSDFKPLWNMTVLSPADQQHQHEADDDDDDAPNFEAEMHFPKHERINLPFVMMSNTTENSRK